ncbi:hypothetical protein [Salinispira pacifica]
MFITLYRVGKHERVHYYTIHNRQGNLFTPYSLTVSWGTSMDGGRERLIILETRRALDEQVRRLIRHRLRQGYRVLYSYFRQDEKRYIRRLNSDDSNRIASSL